MSHLYLIVRIGGQRIALPAVNIGSVVEIEEIEPVPRVAPHVAGLFALRSRVLTVIDATMALGLGQCRRTGAMTAVIATCDTHSYALLVDEVEDVVEGAAPQPCPALLENGWSQASLGMIRHDDAPLLLLDPSVLVGGCRPILF